MMKLLSILLQQSVGATTTESTDVTTSTNIFSEFEGLSIDVAISKLTNGLVDFAFKLAIAILVFFVCKLIITRLYKMTRNVMIRKKVEASLATFILSFMKIVLYFILIIIIIGILGIETSSFLALFASAGVAIGMALSGTLQNFAGGVLILLLKPYKVGDYIEAQGYTGTVKEIQIFHTVINTPDNKAIIIPNGGLSTGSINNYSLEDYRRVDWTVSLAYGTDFVSAKNKIMEILLSDQRVVKEFIEDDIERRKIAINSIASDNEQKSGWLHKHRKHQDVSQSDSATNQNLPKVSRKPFVAIDNLADSSILLTVKAWTHSSSYWDLFYTMNERFYKELPESGFEFPYPQLDLHITK